jgi:amidohydrolase
MDNISELIKNKYKEYESKAIEIRRHLHQYPEASAKEFNTQKFIIDTLNEHNIKCTKIADTGLWAVIAGEKESSNKKTILIRADIDALQIQEETGLDFSSKNPGLMHACGHDGHITNLIISSFILYDLRKEFSGNAKIVFQPSEEVGGGAERMINQGVLENPKVDAAIGLHISATDDANNLYTKYDGF